METSLGEASYSIDLRMFLWHARRRAPLGSVLGAVAP
jgi:hypothetical protein